MRCLSGACTPSVLTFEASVRYCLVTGKLASYKTTINLKVNIMERFLKAVAIFVIEEAIRVVVDKLKD